MDGIEDSLTNDSTVSIVSSLYCWDSPIRPSIHFLPSLVSCYTQCHRENGQWTIRHKLFVVLCCVVCAHNENSCHIDFAFLSASKLTVTRRKRTQKNMKKQPEKHHWTCPDVVVLLQYLVSRERTGTCFQKPEPKSSSQPAS